MSNVKSSDIIRHPSNNANKWKQAIYDAEAELSEAQARVVRLKQAIRYFRALRDKGAPWPGATEATEKADQEASFR